MDPLDRLRSAGKRVTDPLETLSQRVAERVVDLVVQALDVNALVGRVDLNAVLGQVDINKILAQVDVSALVDRVDINEILEHVDIDRVLDRVDLNDLVSRIDMDQLIEQTNLAAVIARSSAGVTTEALDAARSGAVGLDRLIDHWLGRLFWRKHPRPLAPAALLDAAALNAGAAS